uniref:Htr7 protein n=2 Tax=Endopterygota TaxID=33392 RepID=A0A0C9QIT6_9HYME
MEKSEYEIQHFNFSVEQFSLERRHYLNKIISLTLQSMVNKLSMGNDDTAVFLLEQKEKVKSKMLSDMEQKLTAIEEMDLKNFSIPDYVLLATDYYLSKQYTEEDKINADKELADMKQKFLENSVMIASLKIENEKYEETSIEMNNEEKLLVQIQTALQLMESQWEKVKHLAKETESLEQ